jgi:MerR family transcriptional regulator, repressor of the yfmOP operon
MAVRKNSANSLVNEAAKADIPIGASATGNTLPYMNISDLARKLDISPRTIRYYEEIGLLDSIKRTVGGKRVFTDNDLRRIRFIQKLKILGLTLAEMQELNAIYETHRKNSKVFPRIIELFDNHKKSIDHRMDELKLLKAEIDEFQKRMRDKLKKERE